MEKLNGKKIRHLRSLGQKIQPLCTIGKAGPTEGVVSQVSTLLETHELLKVRLPAGPATERKQLAEVICEACDAYLVGVLGRTALIYKPS